jgi:hypothetical protein
MKLTELCKKKVYPAEDRREAMMTDLDTIIVSCMPHLYGNVVQQAR